MVNIKKLLLIILIITLIYISSFIIKKTTFFNIEKDSNNKNIIIVYVKDKDLYLDLEDYVVGVVGAEMPASFDNEALKAQAVASRSYLLSKANSNVIEITSTINDQVFQTNNELKNKWGNSYNKYYEKILQAVMETEGEIVSRNGKTLKT